MKKLICVLVGVLFGTVVLGQSVFKVLGNAARTTSKSGVLICRTLEVPKTSSALARDVLQSRKLLSPVVRSNKGCRIVLTTTFNQPLLRDPERIYGGYNYLRLISRISLEHGAVAPGFNEVWKRIHRTAAYNGAHHIVTKATLKEIHARYNLTCNLTDMQNNAPALFHIAHGNPEYSELFHNVDLQLSLYDYGGVSAIIDHFFETSYKISQESLGVIRFYNKETISGTYAEAELWARQFGLRWE